MHGLDKVRDDHLGLFSVEGIALAKCLAEQRFLRVGSPCEGRDNPAQHDHEGRPAAEGERFARSEQYQAYVDGVAHEAIGAGCNEACALNHRRHETPCRAEFASGPDDQGAARNGEKASAQRQQ